MGSLQAPLQLNGGNGQPPIACPKGKKMFASRGEAERFEFENHKRFPNEARQHAYQCEECPAYHLSAKSADAFAIGQTNLKKLEGRAVASDSKKSAKRGRRGDKEAAVKALWLEGLSDTEIASRLGVSYQTVSYHRKKIGPANRRGEHNSALRQIKPPLTLSEIDEQKRLLDEQKRSQDEEYQAKLLRIEQQKQQLVEANRVTVYECQDGQALLVKFGSNEHMVVPKEKIEELTHCLLQWV